MRIPFALRAVAMLPLCAGMAIAQTSPVSSNNPTGCTHYVSPEPRRAAPDDGWCDPAPHRETGVVVAPGVKLHVLDFGGRGMPLVFLSGIGNNAHVFDDFAQRFTKNHRVIAITRRGFGESSHPEGGYDQATLANDVRVVLDSLGIRRAILAGHSIGGYEITHFAASYPDRVAGLIYLDAGSDPVSADSIRAAHAAELTALAGLSHPPAPVNVLPTPADSASAKAAWAYRVRVGLTDNTESAVRAAYFYEGFNPYLANNNPAPARMLAAISHDGHTPFGRVQAPAIFILAERDSIQHQPADVRAWIGDDPLRSAAVQRQLDATGAIAHAQREYIARELKGSRMILIHGARHLIFMSHPDEVERAMKAFMTPLR
jgi:non-heme chloroperoxidase